MDGLDALHCVEHCLLAEQTWIHLANDAIAQTKEDMQWSRNNAIRRDGEQCWLVLVQRLLVCRRAISARA